MNKSDWTAERQSILVDMAKGSKTAREVAAALGISRNAVLGRAFRSGVSFGGYDARERAALPPCRLDGDASRLERVAEVRRLYLAGERYTAIAAATGVPMGSIPSLLKDLPRRRATSWSTSAIVSEAKLAILTAHYAGESERMAAARFGVSESSIANWKRTGGSLIEEAKRLGAAIKAAAEARQAAESLAAQEAEAARRAGIDVHNTPLLPSLSAREQAIFLRRQAGEALEEIGLSIGVTRERVRQIQVKCIAKGLRLYADMPLTEGALRLVDKMGAINRAPKRRGPTPKTPRGNVFALAHRLIDGARKEYDVSPEERARRSERMRRMWAERRP